MKEQECTGISLITYSKIRLLVEFKEFQGKPNPPSNHNTLLPKALKEEMSQEQVYNTWWVAKHGLVWNAIRELWSAGRGSRMRASFLAVNLHVL